MSRAGEKLTHGAERFALEYLANGYNATAAYRSVHPKCSQRTAEVNGCRLLRKAEVQTFIEREQDERGKRLRMDGDEALIAISRMARSDLRKLFRNNRLLPVSEWPEDIADCVKALKPTPFGTSIVLHDKLKALELLAIASGALKPHHQHKHSFDVAAYLAAEPPAEDE
jgi:hypothetical protein